MLKLGARSFLFAAAFATALGASASAQSMDLPAPVGMAGDPAAQLVENGNAAFLHGDLRGAAAYYRDALRRKNDFAIATFNLGLFEMHTGAKERGIADMNRGIDLATQHGMSSRDVGRLRTLRSAFTDQTKPT